VGCGPEQHWVADTSAAVGGLLLLIYSAEVTCAPRACAGSAAAALPSLAAIDDL
jgi:hypothetical protein